MKTEVCAGDDDKKEMEMQLEATFSILSCAEIIFGYSHNRIAMFFLNCA